MKGNGCLAAGLCILLCLAGCRSQGKAPLPGADSAPESSAPAVPVDSVPAEEVTEPFDANTSIQAVMDDPVFGDTGLFFFKGNPGEKFALCNAGGGFAYVGAMQDSFPHALTLSKQGYNAFALIYRPGAQTACEDLAFCPCAGAGSGHRLLQPLGWLRRGADGGMVGLLWSGGLWRG